MRIESLEESLLEEKERERERETQTLEEILLCLFGLDSWGSSIIDKLKSVLPLCGFFNGLSSTFLLLLLEVKAIEVCTCM